jgi:hypothetical protein
MPERPERFFRTDSPVVGVAGAAGCIVETSMEKHLRGIHGQKIAGDISDADIGRFVAADALKRPCAA